MYSGDNSFDAKFKDLTKQIVDGEKSMIVALKELLQGVDRNTEISTKLFSYYNKSLIGKGSKFVKDLVGASIPGLAGYNAYKMEELQKKSVIIGTNANKLGTLMTNEMKKLNTDTYTILDEKLDLLGDGFRDNNEELTKLGVRMKVTGQDTALLHKTMQKMYITGGLNNEQIGDLSKTIVEYGVKYGVSNEKLLNTLSQMSNVLVTANIAGLGKKFADVGTIISAKFPMLAEIVPHVLEEITDLSLMPAFARLGLSQNELARTIDDASQSGENVSTKLINAFSKVNTTLTNSSQMAAIIRRTFPGMEPLLAMANATKTGENRINPLSQPEDEYYKSFSNYKDMTLAFYATTTKAYESLIGNTNMMLTLMGGTVGASLGYSAGGMLGSVFARRAKRLASAGITGAFTGGSLGPWGAAIGAALGVGLELFASNPVQKRIADSTEKTANILDKQFGINANGQGGNGLTNLMSNSIDSILQNAQGPVNPSESIVEKLDELIRAIKARQMETNGRAIRIGQ